MLRHEDIDRLIMWSSRAMYAGVSPLRIRDELRRSGLADDEVELVVRAAEILFDG